MSIGLSLLALALLAGCSSPIASHRHQPNHGTRASPASTAPSTPATAPTPAAPAAPTPTPVQVQSSVCGATGSTISVQGNVTFNGAPYLLQIQMADYHGPGTYSIPPERVSLQSPSPSPTSPLRPALSGTVTVSSGGQGGTVNAELGPPGQTPVPLSATWSCS